MKLKKINELKDQRYKPIVDILAKTVEDTLPDTINELGLWSIIDFYEDFPDSLRILLYVNASGKICDIEGRWVQDKRRFALSLYIESYRVEDEAYAKFLQKQLVSDLANIILHIVRFAKTGEVETDETTGVLKHLL